MRAGRGTPKISICIPTFNRADLLNQTLQSVASQTIKPFEVIVTDNCSSDNTKSVAQWYQKKHGFRFIQNNRNVGMIGNWNRAISLARGDYICLLHSDDLISPDWHQTWLETISKHEADFYTCAIAIIDAKNKPLFTCHIYKESRPMNQPDTMKLFLQQLAPVIAPSGASIYKRRIFDEIGLFQQQYGTESDLPHFIQIATRYNVYYLNKILFTWRTHPAQTFDKEKANKTTSTELQRVENSYRILKSREQLVTEKIGKDNQFIQTNVFMSLCSINLYLAKGKFEKVIKANTLALHIFPRLIRNLDDMRLLIKIQLLMIKRALLLKRINKIEKVSLEWLQAII